MGRRPKEDLSYFTNNAGEIQYAKCCIECPHSCKQSFRAIVQCPRYTEFKKRLRASKKKDVDKISKRMI